MTLRAPRRGPQRERCALSCCPTGAARLVEEAVKLEVERRPRELHARRTARRCNVLPPKQRGVSCGHSDRDAGWQRRFFDYGLRWSVINGNAVRYADRRIATGVPGEWLDRRISRSAGLYWTRRRAPQQHERKQDAAVPSAARTSHLVHRRGVCPELLRSLVPMAEASPLDIICKESSALVSRDAKD